MRHPQAREHSSTPRPAEAPHGDPALADDALLEALVGIALEAGRAALGRRGRDRRAWAGEAAVAPREAAQRARDVILEGLAEIAPGAPALGEGLAPPSGAPTREHFLVDPMDGVAELAPEDAGTREFTIDIGLVAGGAPVAGVVYAPALEQLWAARPGAAWRAVVRADSGAGPGRAIRVRPAPEHGVAAVASRANRSPELEAFLRAYRVADHPTAGCSLKLCLLAEGSADLYPELGRSMAWSTAAGDAILRAAGGRTVTLDGAPLAYASPFAGDESAHVNPHFVALGSIGLRGPAPA